MDVYKIQKLLTQFHMDGWLFTDFQGHDFLSKSFLKLTDRVCTRQLFYYIPVSGEPVKLLSAIEPLLLDHLPGQRILYKGMEERHRALEKILIPKSRVACQYSPDGNVPVISSMDAGLIEYLKGFDIELVSSADIMQHFGAILDDEQIESHKQAATMIHRILNKTFVWIRKNIDQGTYINEWMMLQEMKRLIANENIHMDGPPFFGIDEHGCDPGYEPSEIGSKEIKEGSRLMIDIAGRLPEENAIYYDISWCMNVGPDIDPEYEKLFNIVWNARQQALDYIQTQLDNQQSVRGCDVDALTQSYFKSLDLGQYIMHRTGHNIGHTCHGIGANLDDYETHDTRSLLPGTMFSIEPGIYTGTYGVRLEYDVHITEDRKATIYGPIQDKILVI